MDNELNQYQQTATIPQRLHPIDLYDAQYEAALQNLHILANQQGEAEATLKTATSLGKFKQADFSSAPNHAAMKPIANWMSFATNRECWKAIVKNFVEKKYR